jgi:uncharacterized membrane protein HdeD (DUF308 family)
MVKWATANARALPAMGEDVLTTRWRWFLGLGVVVMALGVFALGASATREPIVVPLFGWTLVVAGTLVAMHGILRRQWGGFVIELSTGILYGVAGITVIADPYRSAEALSLMLAVFLLIHGTFRLVMAAVTRFPHRPWLALHGAASIGLGVGIWAGWPFVGMWVLGLFIGAELILGGLVLAMLGLSARRGSAFRPPAEHPLNEPGST